MVLSLRTLAAAAVSALTLCACPPPEPNGPHKPPEPPPVVIDPAAGDTCATACVNFRRLECDEGEPSPAGVPCEAICQNVQASGIIAWDLACRSSVTECPQIQACER